MRSLEGGRGYMGDLKEEKAIWGDLKEEGACDERNWKKEEGCVCVWRGGDCHILVGGTMGAVCVVCFPNIESCLVLY